MYYGQVIKEQGSTGPIPSVPFNQPKNLFRYGEQTLWSTQLHADSAALANGTFRMFTTPLGQVGQGFTQSLSIGETNLKEGGRIPSGIAYDVFGVACQIGRSGKSETSSAVATLGKGITVQAQIQVLRDIEANGVLSWDFTQTQVDIAPIELIGAGGGTFGSLSVSANVATSVGNMNNGAGSVWLYRKHPVALPGNSTFSILLRYGSRAAAIPTAGGDGIDYFVKVVLLGYYKNVIEIG